MKKLSAGTIRRLRTATVIVDVHSVVKELVENALDAGATRIAVRLEGGGLQSIEVRDNGKGIPRAEVALAVAPYYTSKIDDFKALESLQSYGFRGEALHSICNNCGELRILTRTADDECASITTFDHKGQTLSSKPAPLAEPGTVVVVSQLFKDTPVRLQVARSKVKEETKRLLQTMWAYGLVRPDVHFTVRCLPQIDLSKPPLPTTAAAIKALFGDGVFDQLQEVNGQVEGVASFSGYLPRGNSLVDVVTRPANDRTFIFVNYRPVDVPQIARLVNKHVRRHFLGENGDHRAQRRYAFVVLHWTMSPGSYDVNCSPDKRLIMLHAIEPILERLGAVLQELYPSPEASGFAASASFAAYAAAAASPSHGGAKVTVVSPTARTSTQLSLAKLGSRLRGDDVSSSSTPGLDETRDADHDGDDEEDDDDDATDKQRRREARAAHDDGQEGEEEPPTQAYAPLLVGDNGNEDNDDGAEVCTQVYRAAVVEDARALLASSPPPPPSAAAAAAAAKPRGPPSLPSPPPGVAGAGGAGDGDPAGRSPYLSFLASVDPARHQLQQQQQQRRQQQHQQQQQQQQRPPLGVSRAEEEEEEAEAERAAARRSVPGPLPPKRKLFEIPLVATRAEEHHHHHNDEEKDEDEDEEKAEEEPRAAKALKTEAGSSRGRGREVQVDVGLEALSQRIAATQLAASCSAPATFGGSIQGSSPSSSSSRGAEEVVNRARLVGLARMVGEREDTVLVVSLGPCLLAVSTRLAEQALAAHEASRSGLPASGQKAQGTRRVTREGGEYLLARLRSARLLEAALQHLDEALRIPRHDDADDDEEDQGPPLAPPVWCARLWPPRIPGDAPE